MFKKHKKTGKFLNIRRKVKYEFHRKGYKKLIFKKRIIKKIDKNSIIS